jgi:HPt (histidine-containing phosphotransfer) domain-containing protein
MNPIPHDDDLLDAKQLEQFTDTGLDDYTDLFEEMIGDAPSTLQGIREALMDGDPRILKSRAHSAKGMFASYGCAALAGFLATLERGLPDLPGKPADISEQLDALWTRTELALLDWLARNSGT